MKINSIITLENNNKYIVLEEVTLDNKIYFLASLIDDVKNNIVFLDSKEFKDSLFVKIVKDEEMLLKLISLVKNKY